MVSIVCEAFGCPPDVALRQDWRLVKGILEYRLAESAKRQHNIDATKLTKAQVDFWEEMCAALVELKGQG